MRWFVLLTLLWSVPAWATGVVALSDSRVVQYKDALAGAREVLGGSVATVDASAADAAQQLNRAEPSVILAVGQRALEIAKARTPVTPVVFCMVVGGGSMASRSVTGVKLETTPATQLEQLKAVHPNGRRIGVIYDPHTSAATVQEAVNAAGRLGLTLVTRPVADAKAVRPALQDIAESIDALLLLPDPHIVTSEMFRFLLSFTLERNIALFGFLESFTKAGALASFAPDYEETGRRAAKMAMELAAKSADARMPVPAPVPSPGALTINMKTAQLLNIKLSPAIVSKARRVYQ